MSRTRSKDEVSTSPGQLVVEINNNSGSDCYVAGRLYGPGQHTYTIPNEPSSKEGYVGTITDEIGAPEAYNDVVHTKTVYDCPMQVVKAVGSDSNGSDDVQVTSTATIGCGWYCDWGLNSWPYQDPVSTLVAEATTRANPSRIDPGDVNLPQFVGELRELKDAVLTGSASHLSLLNQLAGSPSKRRVAQMTYGDVLRVLASADLALKFGIEPLLADIKAIGASLERLIRLYDKLRNSEPFRVYGHASRVDTADDELSGSHGSWKNSREYKTHVVAWALVRFTNPFPSAFNLKRLSDKWKLLASYYRLNAPVRTAWELMPLSFVVDWFVDIGSALDRFDNVLLELPYEVQASGYSVKKTSTVNISQRYADCVELEAYHAKEPFPVVAGKATKTQYSRVATELPWDTAAWAPPTVRFPDLGKLGTLAELIITFSKA